jgi:hypothetical protein
MTSRKPTPMGTDPVLCLPTERGAALPLTYWDLWFAVVIAKDFGGDLSRLAERLADEANGLSPGRRSAERKLSHLRDLQRRLTEAGRTIDHVLTAAGNSTVTELRRARQRVLESTEREREWSEAMRQTPRVRRQAEALRGTWPLFPVSPQLHAARISSQFEKDFYGENASFGVVRKLELFLDEADKLLVADQHVEAQALLRAWLTVAIELMARADDSFGCIGECFRRGFATYLNIPLENTGIEEAVFFTDLLSLLIWEDYGLTWRQTEGYFRSLGSERASWCLGYLRRQIEELRGDDLVYQSEKALTLLGEVVAEQERFELFEGLAREMGAREWERIIRLADRAVKNRKRELARKVFEAALTSGSHLTFLRKKYEQLEQGKWNPDPKK